MSIWSYIWPWSQERRNRLAKEEEVERLFRKQLKTAEQRQRGLRDATDKIREARERRRDTRVPFQSQPLLQD